MVLGASAAEAADCTRPKGLKGTIPHVIKFETGSAEISPEEQAWLADQAERFQSHPSLEVCVIGQADKTGDTELNVKLALERAETVAAFLKEKGLGDKKFQVVGRGEAFGDTKDSLIGQVLEGELAADRRVEVTIYR
jgi:outer membrane protein OmpA-like peptidoglycan-associated protein